MPMLMDAPTAAELSHENPRFRQIVREGDTAPPELGGTYSKIVSAAIDDSGAVTFSADLEGSRVCSALLLKSRDRTQVVLHAGDKAADGSTFRRFLELDRGYARFGKPVFAFLLFRAELEGVTSAEGLFLLGPDSQIQAIAKSGGISPRGLHYLAFSQPTIQALTSNFGPTYYLAFVARMREGNKSLVVMDGFSGTREPLSTGDSFAANTVADFSISRAGLFALSAVVDMQTSSGRVFKDTLLVGALVVGGTKVRTGGKIRGLSTIQEIVGPPGIYLQVAVVLARLKDGKTALVAREVMGGTTVLARQGDSIPKLPGRKLRSFGPPVGNDRTQWIDGEDVPPAACACLVGLSKGELAVWIRLIRVKPSNIATVIHVHPLVPDAAGCDLSAPQEILLVKLTNTGKLLFSGIVGAGSNRRSALFELGGLFSLPEE